FLSTALGGLAFGFAWSALLSLAYLARQAEAVRPVGLGVTTALGFMLAGGAHIAFAHRSDMQRYALKIQTQTMSTADWRQSGWASLPARRLALFGEFDQPFTVQWLGGIAVLKSELQARGWRLPVNWTARSLLEFLSPHPDLTALPVLPRLDSGRSERLVMIKAGAGIPKDERLVFRLWRSDVQVPMPDGSLTSLWIGTVTDERMERMFSLLNIPEDRRNMNTPLHRLASDISCSRVVRRMKAGNSSFWNGSVLLGPFKPCGILKPVKSPL
ncbi:MAG TPA: LssY C-terminal domain-containing protein, partial [Acetobacteraceae bacterium]|nr:LssY C-terminal domain-containing protein [Acetobacteraceae bacterium]